MKDEQNTEYEWTGDWQGPENGSYVIRIDGREMEPGEVVDLLDRFEELLLQTQALQADADLPVFKSSNIPTPAEQAEELDLE